MVKICYCQVTSRKRWKKKSLYCVLRVFSFHGRITKCHFNKQHNISSVSIHSAWYSTSQARDQFCDSLHASPHHTGGKKWINWVSLGWRMLRAPFSACLMEAEWLFNRVTSAKALCKLPSSPNTYAHIWTYGAFCTHAHVTLIFVALHQPPLSLLPPPNCCSFIPGEMHSALLHPLPPSSTSAHPP